MEMQLKYGLKFSYPPKEIKTSWVINFKLNFFGHLLLQYMHKKLSFILGPQKEQEKRSIYQRDRERKPFKINGDGTEDEEGGKGRENNNGYRPEAHRHEIAKQYSVSCIHKLHPNQSAYDCHVFHHILLQQLHHLSFSSIYIIFLLLQPNTCISFPFLDPSFCYKKNPPYFPFTCFSMPSFSVLDVFFVFVFFFSVAVLVSAFQLV
jgi:hypothetical protein